MPRVFAPYPLIDDLILQMCIRWMRTTPIERLPDSGEGYRAGQGLNQPARTGTEHVVPTI